MLTLIKRLLHLIDSGGLYGAERMLLALVEEQIKQGLEPMILSAGDTGVAEKPLEAEARRLGLPITAWRMKPGFNLKAAKQILQWAKEQRFAVLHSHGYKFNILMGSRPAKLRGLPLVVTLHGYVRAPFPSRMWAYETLDRACLAGADAVAIVSRAMRSRLPKRLARQAHYIPNGIAASPPEPIAPEPRVAAFMHRHRVNLLAAGRLSHEKGFDILLNAMTQGNNSIRDAGVVVYGEGRQRDFLEGIIKARALEEQVILPGYQPELAALMPHFDALVMPSRTEGMPMLLLEAMRAQLPIIASKVGGIPEMLEATLHAELVAAENPTALARGIERILHRSITRSADSGVSKDASAQTMERRYAGLYNEVRPAASAVSGQERKA